MSMQLPNYVRKNVWWWRFFPWLNRTANTIYPWVYLPVGVFDDLLSLHPSPFSEATLKHETVHWERQKEMGIVRFGFNYFFSREFRYQEELLATEAQIKYLNLSGLAFDIEERARRLSSSEYLWCVSYERAKQELVEMWERV